MPHFSHIIGLGNATERLRRALQNGFPHALVIAGARHLGKATLARAVASSLLETDRPESHPDYRFVERSEDPKTGKLHKGISVDEIRGLREFLQMSALSGGRKTAVIDGAEALTDEAANALLKTLEEPSAGTHIILVVHALTHLPATIRSRSAVLNLARVSDAELEAALVIRGVGAALAREVSAFSAGRPGVALAMIKEGQNMLEWYRKEGERWRGFRAGSLRRRFAVASELAPPREDREVAAARLRDVAAYWESELRRELLGGDAEAPRRLHALHRFLRSLDINVQPRLLLERLALEFEKTL